MNNEIVSISIDLAIAYPGDWWLVSTIIAFSSIGIIFRSLWNESHPINFNVNRLD